MEEEVTNKTGQNLGIAALITAIITFVFAVIPCVGLMAIIPGIIAIVLASVGLSQASRTDSPRGILIAALIIGIVATMISFSQVFVAGKIAQKADKWPDVIEDVVNDVQKDILKDLEDANISIKIENGDESVEISTSVNKKEFVETLEELEGEEDSAAVDTLEQE
jgi:phosphate/sulfate permease